MLLKDFVEKLQSFSPDKHVCVAQGHMDPFYYDSSDTEANEIIIVITDEGDIWEVVETNGNNEIIQKQEIVES